ncbi:MAG: SDR family NAD(P)-dependent oxidoreductase [Deltaproteobacteria bacterium]|nr:SDR family NAD(P)-dependent oxidoreductase [Deltaproteobacteria bacterium]
MSNLNGKIALVTGAAGALGRPISMELARQGARVVLGVRERSQGEALAKDISATTGNAAVDVLVLDLASCASIRAAVKEYLGKHDRLHVLVNNAAAFSGTRRTTKDGFELMLGVNHLGPFLLTNLLLDTLKASAPARIVNMTMENSKPMDFEDLQSEQKFVSMDAFSRSKGAGHYVTVELAKRLEGTGVTVHAVNPTMTATTLIAQAPLPIRVAFKLLSGKPEKNAQTAIAAAAAPEYQASTGKWLEKGEEKPWRPEVLDAATRVKVWEVSAKLVGLAR